MGSPLQESAAPPHRGPELLLPPKRHLPVLTRRRLVGVKGLGLYENGTEGYIGIYGGKEMDL